MKNLDNSNYTTAGIKKIAYVVIGAIAREVIVSGKRIALYGELKSLKKLVDPTDVDFDNDIALLRILDETQVKLAVTLAEHLSFEILERYALVNLIDDDEVMTDEWAIDTGLRFYWRFMFYRRYPLRKDRYINFSKVLRCAERIVYELLKFMVTGQTRAFDPAYRSNYSAGRLKALMAGNEDPNALMLAGLIEKLKDNEREICELTFKNRFF